VLLLEVVLVDELAAAAGFSPLVELSDDVEGVDSPLLAAGFADE
jgi:hypothetical protein